MKLFLALCFFVAAFVSFSWQTNSCNGGCGSQCDENYTYQAVYDTKGKATYGCVPQNECSSGLTNSCADCCGTSPNCTIFFVIRGEPFYICNKCATGNMKTCDKSCTKYGCTCENLTKKPYAPANYSCVAPPPKGTYDCRSFCPVNSNCGILYFNKNNVPYFYCLRENKY